MLQILGTVVGTAVVLVTLMDVFDTVVVPGSTQGWLRTAERIRRLTQPGWKRLHRKGPGPPRISRSFAPFLLLTTFSAWMSLLLLGFSLLAWTFGGGYEPPLRTFPQAIYAAGSSMATIGIGALGAHGPARFVAMGAGLCGLAVVTLTITYILQVQNGLHARDAAILKLTVVAGRPPSGVALLETYAALGCRAQLPQLFQEWREWTANVLNRQSTHPALTYFRSMSADMDWPAAFGAILDAATISLLLLEEEVRGPATLLHREGSRLTAVMVEIFKLRPQEPPPVSPEDFAELCRRLKAAGYPLQRDAELARFVDIRADYLARLTAISEHLGADGLTLLPS